MREMRAGFPIDTQRAKAAMPGEGKAFGGGNLTEGGVGVHQTALSGNEKAAQGFPRRPNHACWRKTQP
jgi:hypothetical protein